MALEVVQGNDDVCIHDSSADLGFLHIFAAGDADEDLICALQAVGNDHMAAGGVGHEAVLVGGFQMIQSVLPGTDIQGVRVGQEGLTAHILNEIHNGPGIAGTQVGHVALLAEVDLDGCILTLKIDLTHAGGHGQPRQLLGKGFCVVGAKIGEINFGFHGVSSLIVIRTQPK